MAQPKDSRQLPPIWRAWIDSPKYQKRIREPGIAGFRHCVEEHQGSCSVSGSELPKRLLDLTNRGSEDTDLIKLVETDQIEVNQVKNPRSIRYAALSYCWGSGNAFKTTPGNLDEHITAGLKVSDMPRTLSDAVRVARDLQIQYLWVDALCILQYQESDHEALQAKAQNDWKHESVRMHAIYGNAWLTIVAAGAAQCDEGLYMLHPTTDNESQHPLYLRAWTLQEWLVSKRLLVFATGAVYYTCSNSESAQKMLHHTRFIGQMRRQLELRASPVISSAARAKHAYWIEIVVNFSWRGLSSRSDKLPAISGVAQKVCSELGWLNKDYRAGLWIGETLLQDLTWAVPRLGFETFGKDLGRRPGRLEYRFSPSRMIDKEEESVETSRAPGRAPSWSWASIDGLIEFGNYSSTQDLATILSCETTLADKGNYFGQVTSGTVVLECSCYMKVLCYEYVVDDPSELMKRGFTTEGGKMPKEKKMYCLGLYKQTYSLPDWSGIYGIVVDFDYELDAYVRLGMAYLEREKEMPQDCKMKSFKIV